MYFNSVLLFKQKSVAKCDHLAYGNLMTWCYRYNDYKSDCHGLRVSNIIIKLHLINVDEIKILSLGALS